MGLSLPTTAAIRRAAQAIFVEPTWRTGEGIMVRLLHRDNLLRGLAPELTDRWRRAGSPPGDLNFETPYGATRLEAHGDFLQIVSIDNDRPNLLFQSDLFALLAGRGLSPERLSEEESLFASALFPPFDSWFWEMDGF